MNVRLIQSWYLGTRLIVISLVASLATISSAALADDYQTTCNFNDELCGWVDLEAEIEQPEFQQPAPEYSGSNANLPESIVAAMATAVGASTGVSFHALVEPFAMVGPTVEEPLRMVQALDQWWAFAVEYSEQFQEFRTEEAIDAIAKLEPIDVEAFGPSVLISAEIPLEDVDLSITGIEVTPIDNLIGSAPMIVTIDEPYLPYDLSAGDLRLRSVFPISTQPFCVRSRAAGWNPVPMWTEVDSLGVAKVVAEPLTDPVDHWMLTSLIEQLIVTTESLTDPTSTIRQYTSPEQLGRQWARMLARGNRVVMETTELIATYWPEPVAKPSASGKALLTRAGVELETSPEIVLAEQIADLYSDNLIR